MKTCSIYSFNTYVAQKINKLKYVVLGYKKKGSMIPNLKYEILLKKIKQY